MKAHPFAYARATSLPEALSLLATPDAKAIAGGQSLLAALAFRLSQPPLLVDIGRLDDLKGIARVGDVVRIGALTTHTELGRSTVIASDAPLLHHAASLIAHPAIRNRGTIGGSLAYADPASELPACVVALDADIIVVSATGERRVKAAHFFAGLLTTALNDGELIAAIEVPARRPGERTIIEEVARRSGDYAMAGVAIRLREEAGVVHDARVIAFGVGETPVVATKAAAALRGRTLDGAAIAAAATALNGDLDPPADQHGSAEMKRHLTGVILARALSKLTSRVAA